MIEVVLDTETTGLSVAKGHRIVEIGCIELKNQIPTNKTFHCYLNPQRKVSEDAIKVHGYTDEFLADKKKFSEVADDFLQFIQNKKLIIDNSRRKFHTALIDCELLSKVYINLIDQKEPKLNFSPNDIKNNFNSQDIDYCKKIIEPTSSEIEEFKLFMKKSLKKTI